MECDNSVKKEEENNTTDMCSIIDSLIYVVMCLLTFGITWVIRIIITKAIISANEQIESDKNE